MEDLRRILSLPQREPIDCEREKGKRRWTARAQALVEVVTAQYSRGPRIACGCRPRHIKVLSGSRLLIFQAPPPKQPPPPPVEVSLDAFVADAAHDTDAIEKVRGLRPGQSVDLPGLDNPFCLVEFNPVQAWGLWEAPKAGGMFGMVSVGGGKTILGVMMPMSMPELRHPDGTLAQWILLAKPNQRLHYRNTYLRLREHFRVPSIVFEDRDDMRGAYRERGQPVLHFIPYSLLSNPKSTRLFDMLDPDGVIADESHLLSNKESSRSLRFLRSMASRSRVFCCWTGSAIKRTMRDCSHLATHSLGLGSPYPILPKHVEAMARVIDPSVTPDRTSPLAEAMLNAFGNKKIGGALFASGFGSDGGIREGHRDRVVRTPGVISTRSSSVDCDLSFKERKLTTKIPQIVIDKLRDARAGIRPDGEELVEAMEVSMCCRHVGCGYYHCWVFPRSTEEDRAEGGTIDQWYAARKAFNKELRAKVLRGEPDLDSRKLCEDAARRAWMSPPYDGDKPIWPAINWPAWAAIEDAVYYEARTKWVDDFIAQDAAAWARENRGIVWVECNELGQRIAELAGVNFHHGGPNAEELLAAEDGSRSIVTTIKANGESTDGLQLKFYRQLVVEPPSSGDRWEQLLGRLVRQGQVEDEVETEIYLHTSEMRDALRSAYMLAQFIEQTTPNRQLLLAADGIEDLI
jgi:hypothetical protein